MRGFLQEWQQHSAVLAAARGAKRKPPVWSLVPIGVLVYIAGTIAAAICLIFLFILPARIFADAADIIGLFRTHQLAFMLAANVPLMAVFIAYMRWIEKRSALSMGFTRGGTLRRYLAGLGWGTLMMLVAAGIACAFGGLRFAGFGEEMRWGLWLMLLVGFLFQGMSEEVMCRGFLMVSAANRAPLWIGVALNSVIFAALHLFNSGVTALSFVNLILYALFASFYFLRTDSIWGIGALHSAWNFVQGCVLGIGVSGNPMPVTAAHFVPAPGSPEAVNGGQFGLEGSIAATLVLVAGILVLTLRPYDKDGRKKLQAEAASVPVKNSGTEQLHRNCAKNSSLFQWIGWLIVIPSFVGMADSLYVAFSQNPAAHSDVLLTIVAFAASCTSGFCMIFDAMKKKKENIGGRKKEDKPSEPPETCAVTDTPSPTTASAAPETPEPTGKPTEEKPI